LRTNFGNAFTIDSAAKIVVFRATSEARMMKNLDSKNVSGKRIPVTM
jgi:hypothetical protein